MRITLVSSLLVMLLFTACSQDASVVTTAGAATLPADVRDLAKPVEKNASEEAAPANVQSPNPSPISATGELISISELLEAVAGE